MRQRNGEDFIVEKWINFVITSAVGLVLFATTAAAEDLHQFEKQIKACPNPCVISYNPGGVENDFLAAARYVRIHRVHVIINGVCNSACAVFADAARPNACITKRARFGFHRVRYTRYDDRGVIVAESIPGKGDPRGIPRQSRDIVTWVNSHGKFPVIGLTRMYAKSAKKFWPICKRNGAPR